MQGVSKFFKAGMFDMDYTSCKESESFNLALDLKVGVLSIYYIQEGIIT